MTETSAVALVLDLDKDVLAHPAHIAAETFEHLETSFLGADKVATKYSELEHLHQLGGMKMSE